MNLGSKTDYINPKATHVPGRKSLASIRRIPYPYRAMLAICSDLDETPDRQTYFEIARYLNTTDATVMGHGVGLEIGNTIYFDMPPDQFAYWNTDDKGRRMIQALIQSGHIDCLHSFGDIATTRAHAERNLAELARHNCPLEVWVDHGKALSNFDQDIMFGQGDLIGSKVYHADISTDFGIKYVWRGRVTSIIGQDVPRQLNGIWTSGYPVISAKTFLKEFAKGIFAYCGSDKYAMHGPNRIMREIQLCGGQKVFEFLRSTFHWGGISFGDNADGLPEALREQALSRLVDREGISIIYTHLGKLKGNDGTFAPATKQALKLLAQYLRSGKILVTTTHRILSYCRAIRDLKLSALTKNDCIEIEITSNSSEKNLQGLTIYVPSQKNIKVILNGRKVKNLNNNAPDHTGQPSVSFPWNWLEFPAFD